jgi:hypothetical protein
VRRALEFPRPLLTLQKFRRLLAPEAAGDASGRITEVVLKVERGAVFNERLDRGVDDVGLRTRD